MENQRETELKIALTALLKYAERQECPHDDTGRAGAIWTICSRCGTKWADDLGGFKPYKEPEEITKARDTLCPNPELPMNRDPQPESRDPKPEHPDPDIGRPIFQNRCRRCRRPFDTLNHDRSICPACVYKSPEPNDPTTNEPDLRTEP